MSENFPKVIKYTSRTFNKRKTFQEKYIQRKLCLSTVFQHKKKKKLKGRDKKLIINRTIKRHYISRNNIKTGIPPLNRKDRNHKKMQSQL